MCLLASAVIDMYGRTLLSARCRQPHNAHTMTTSLLAPHKCWIASLPLSYTGARGRFIRSKSHPKAPKALQVCLQQAGRVHDDTATWPGAPGQCYKAKGSKAGGFRSVHACGHSRPCPEDPFRKSAFPPASRQSLVSCLVLTVTASNQAHPSVQPRQASSSKPRRPFASTCAATGSSRHLKTHLRPFFHLFCGY